MQFGEVKSIERDRGDEEREGQQGGDDCHFAAWIAM